MRHTVTEWKAWEVQPLTSDIVAQIQGEAEEALDDQGGGCSLRGMEDTCFASERCADPRSLRQPTKLANLLAQQHKFVVMTSATSPQPKDMMWKGKPKFVGCVTANPAIPADALPYGVPIAGGMMLSTLCVAKLYQGLKVSTALIEKVKQVQRDRGPPVVLLQVVRGTGTQGEVKQAFEVRVPKLAAVYSKMGFRQVGESPTHLLFRCHEDNRLFLHAPEDPSLQKTP